MKKSDLSRKVLCTILAASTFGVCGSVLAQQADIFENDNFYLAVGEHYTDNGNNVHIENATVTVDGTYDVNNVGIKGGSTITVNGTGVVHEGIDMGINPANSDVASTLYAKDAEIHGIVDIEAGTMTLEGGKILASGYLQIEDGINYVQEYVRVDSQGKLTATNVNITGNVMAENTGSVIEINGGSINESEWYAQKEDNNNNLVMVDGKPVVDGYTDVQAEMGGKVTINDAAVNSSLDAQGAGSLITVNNSNVVTKDGIIAWNGGKVILNGSADTVYKVDTDGTGYGYFMAAKLAGEDAGRIEITGGTLKADNLRYLVGLEGNNYAYLNEEYDAEHIENFEIVTGGIVLKDNGIIETKADQIFEHGVDVTNDETVLNSESGKVTNTAISYEGGTLKFNDEKYSLNYLNSAVSNLKEYQADSETKIVMTGDLVTEGEADNTISVEDAAAIGSDVALDKVTVVANGDLVVGDTGAGAVSEGFSAGQLDLGDGTNVTIKNDKNVTLGGSQGGEIIKTTGEAANVTIGDSGEKGSFTIGNALATSETEYTLTGSVIVNTDSNLTTNGQTTITDGVTLNNGSVDAVNGALKANITANGTSTITGAVNTATLTGANGTVINIGSEDKAGNVVVGNATLNGATVFLDPAWKGNDVISDASNMAVETSTKLDGKYAVGQNSVLSFGVDNTAEAQEVFAKTGLTWGEQDITAALYLADSVDLTNGAIVVNGTLTAAPTINNNGTFTAAANSVTMIDGAQFTADAAIKNAANVTVNAEAKLYIDNAKNNETYKVINGANAGWDMGNIISANALLKFKDAGTESAFDVTANYDKVDNVYGAGAVVIADVVDKTLEVGKDGDAAYDFFNAAANSKTNATKAAQVAAFNSAANMGEMGGVNHAAYSVSNAMTDAVADHLSIATHGDQDKDIWAHYVHNKENIEGISLGGLNADYDLQYNGIVVGSDLYKKGKATAGIALSYVEGDVTNSNLASYTKNEAEYYGASVYGRIDNGNSAVIGDITYMHGSSDITQNNSGYKLTADADTDVFSIGVRAEQKVEAGIGQFVPYAGLRYMHLGTGNYTNSIGMNYDVDEQNLWLLPVGVTYSCDTKAGDWTIRPVVEAGYVWAMGDRDTNQTVSLNGAANGFGFDTADSGSFVSRFAVEAEKANVTYGLGYEYQKGDTVKANKWMANLTWSF